MAKADNKIKRKQALLHTKHHGSGKKIKRESRKALFLDETAGKRGFEVLKAINTVYINLL